MVFFTLKQCVISFLLSKTMSFLLVLEALHISCITDGVNTTGSNTCQGTNSAIGFVIFPALDNFQSRSLNPLGFLKLFIISTNSLPLPLVPVNAAAAAAVLEDRRFSDTLRKHLSQALLLQHKSSCHQDSDKRNMLSLTDSFVLFFWKTKTIMW